MLARTMTQGSNSDYKRNRLEDMLADSQNSCLLQYTARCSMISITMRYMKNRFGAL